MAVSVRNVLFPNKTTQQAVQSAGLNPIASSLILIDNKDYNAAASRYFQQGNSRDVGIMERILGKASGFRGNAVDASGKADLQYFNVKISEEMDAETRKALSPAARGFLDMLVRSAQGEGYDVPSTVQRSGVEFGGVGGEFKSSRVVFKVEEQDGGNFALKATGPGRSPSLSTTIAQRTVGPKSTLQFASDGEEEFARQQALGPKATGAGQGVFSPQFFVDLLYDNKGITTKLFGAAGAASIKTVRLKARNVFTQVTLEGIKGARRNFIYFLEGVKPNPSDFSGNWDSRDKTFQWKFTTSFERKLERALVDQLGNDALKYLDSPQFVKRVREAGAGILVLGNNGKMGGLDQVFWEGRIETTSSVPIPIKVRVKVPRDRKPKATKKQPPTRGKFISNAQLSAILQQRLAKNMPRYSQPIKPTPRYITGKLAQSFQIMANYRQGIIGFYNTPPASGYVDLLNQGGWLLDETLVEPTIRQITQQLIGRQFRVLRTQ